MGNISTSLDGSTGEVLAAERMDKTKRWARAAAFIAQAPTLCGGSGVGGLEGVLLLPRAMMLEKGRKTFPTFSEAARRLRSAAEIMSKAPHARLLFVSYMSVEQARQQEPSSCPPPYTPARIGTDEMLWQRLYNAASEFLSAHEDLAYVWVASSCCDPSREVSDCDTMYHLVESKYTLALLTCDAVLVLPTVWDVDRTKEPPEYPFTDLASYLTDPWALLEGTLLPSLTGTQVFLHFRFGGESRFTFLSPSTGTDTISNAVTAAIASLQIQDGTPVERNWAAHIQPSLVLSWARDDVSRFCEAAGALRQAICSMSITEQQIKEFMSLAALLSRMGARVEHTVAMINLLCFAIAYLEGCLVTPREPGFAAAVLQESLIDDGSHLDLWMKDLGPLDLKDVLNECLYQPSAQRAKIKCVTVGSSHTHGEGLGNFLMHSPELETLEVEWEAMRDLESLSLALPGHKCLTKLNLTHNGIGPEACSKLAQGLLGNDTLTELDLRENMIGPRGMKYLTDAILIHPKIAMLYVMDNNVGDEGAIAVTEVLMRSHVLKKVGLDGNNITDEGGKVLMVAVQESHRLEMLSMTRNFLGDSCKEQLLAAFSARGSDERAMMGPSTPVDKKKRTSKRTSAGSFRPRSASVPSASGSPTDENGSPTPELSPTGGSGVVVSPFKFIKNRAGAKNGAQTAQHVTAAEDERAVRIANTPSQLTLVLD